MSLSGLLPLLYDQRGYGALAKGVASGKNVSAEATLDPARPYFLSALHADVTSAQSRPMIIVTPRSDRARQLYEGLLAYSPPGTPVLLFPAPDLLPFERIAPDPTIVGERLRVLATLTSTNRPPASNPQPPIIVSSVLALMQPSMAPTDMAHAIRLLRKGQHINQRELLGHLVDLGYSSAPLVEEPGQFSRRGGIVDLFPPTSNLPVRIEFFGDEIDSLRVFSPPTQRSEGQADALLVTPACEMPLWKREQAAALVRQIDTSNLREEVLEEWNDQLQKIESGDSFEGMELFAPYYTEPLASLADYLAEMRSPTPDHQPLLVLDDVELIRLEAQEVERQAAELYSSFKDNGELPPGMRRPYLSWEAVAEHGRGLPTLTIGGGAEGALETPGFTLPPLYTGNIAAAIVDIQEMLEARSRIVIVSQQSGRLRELLEDEDIYPTLRKNPPPSISAPPSSHLRVVGVEPVALSERGTGLIESLLTPPPPG
ncbi:MAG: hypothetical protein IVW55_16335, partial [Chloroflexi bacterium]|nr:hypothetical protein [Chloroflexota bacterium]